MNSQLNLFNKNLQLKGRYITINNATEQVKCLVREHENNVLGIDTKYVFLPIKYEIKQGDVITLNDSKYLVINKEFSINNIYTKCIMRKLHHTIKIKYANTDTWTIDCFIVDNIQTMKAGTIIEIATGSILVTIPYTNKTKLISESTRFFAMGKRVWKAVGVTTTDDGLIKLYCDKDGIITNDDKENLIAHNANSVDVEPVEEPTPPEEEEPEIPEEPEPPTDNYVLAITGENDIYTGFDDVWTATLTNNGVAVTDKAIVWDIYNADFTSTPYATITAFSGMTVTVLAKDNTKYIGKKVLLMCECVELDLYVEKEIKIIGLF